MAPARGSQGRRGGRRAGPVLALALGALALQLRCLRSPRGLTEAFIGARRPATSLGPHAAAGAPGRGGLLARAAEDLSSLKVAELKELLREAGLPVSGTKPVLIERLQEAGVGPEAGEEAPAPKKGRKAAAKKPAAKRATKKKAEPVAEAEEEEEEDEEEPAPAKKTKKKAAKKAAKPSGGPFEVQEAVEGFYEDDNDWYPAKVVADLGAGMYKVAWDEDDEEYNLDPGYIRKPLDDVDRDGPFLPGEAVRARCDEDGEIYGGIIQSENDDGTFTLLWDEDGEEHTCGEESMVKVAPPGRLEDLQAGQKVRGIVGAVKEGLGAFVDIGVGRDGLLHFSSMKEEERKGDAPFQEGDRVEALCDEDGEWYPATVDEVHGDRTCTITWDEDGDEPYKAKFAEMRLQSENWPVKTNDVVELWVSNVNAEAGRYGLSMFEGGRSPGGLAARTRPSAETFEAFRDVHPDEWLNGEVVKIMNFGAFVNVESPAGGSVHGLVHVSQMKDGFVEDPWAEVEEGQQVKVRVTDVDPRQGRLSLSMKP